MSLIVLALAATACEPETIGKLTVRGDFEPAMLDFGEVPVGSSAVLTTSLKSTGSARFEIEKIQVATGFGVEAMKGALEGTIIPAGSELDLTVTFFAVREGEVIGTLEVWSGETKAVLDLRGNAVIRRVPMLSLQPTALEFGAVEIGVDSRKDVTIVNNGTAPGTIDRVNLQSTGTDIRGTDEYRYDYGLPITVAEGGSVTIPIIFRPASEGPRPDTMIFIAGQGSPLELTLSGEGRVPLGEILCTPSSLAFGQVERAMSMDLSVRCEARGGPARLIGASITGTDATYFGMRNPPSTLDLAAGQGVDVTVSYRPDGEIARHAAALNLQYSGGMGMATVVVPLTGELIPPPPTATAISLILRWDTDGTDVDLHLVRPGGTAFSFFDDSDCYYLNTAPDWGAANNQADNPYLDRDDIDGRGPEQINLSQTAPGTYTVLAHYFSDHNFGRSTATVEVYIAGNLAGTFMRNLGCDDLWTVGTINWNGTTGTFNPSTNVQGNSAYGSCRP